MRPITVSVGPLAAASNLGGAVPLGTVGGFNLGQTPTGGSNARAFVGNGGIVGGVLTISSTTSGAISGGMSLSGYAVAPNTRVIGPGPTPGTWRVSPTQTSAGGAVYGNQVITLDAPRQITITNTEPAGANSFTVVGTDAAGNQISETLVSTGAAVTTQQNFATVTQISCSAPTTAAATAGTAATATSPWVMFDPYASGGAISKQAIVNGVANYTVQVSYDDPNAPGGVPPGGMGWTNDTDATFVGATTSLSGSWPYTPLWARVLLNSGAGSVRATFIQPGNLGR
jgi:hypothetical protein